MSLANEIQAWVDGRKKALVESYNQEGLKASGRWERELTDEITITPEKINIKILGARYTEQMVRGRGATQNDGDGSLKKQIRQWIDDKGIIPDGDISKDTLAFLITRKIHRDGIRVPNKYNSGIFIDRVFYTTDGTLNQFRDMLKKHYAIISKQVITQGL